MTRTATWKHAERMVAKWFGGFRTGCNGESRRDVEHETLSIEVKHRKTLPAWMHNAMAQARSEAEGRTPIVVLHENGMPYGASMVVISLSDFVDLYGEVS